MNMYYQLLTTEEEIEKSTLMFLNAQLENGANWNSNREAFICGILYQYIHTRPTGGVSAAMIDEWFSMTCIHKSGSHENVLICKKIFPYLQLNDAKCRYIRYVLCTILLMLSANKHIKPIKEVNFVIIPDFAKSRLFHSLPTISKLFFLISTPKNYVLASSLNLLPKQVEEYMSKYYSNLSNRYKSWTGSSAVYRRYFFHENISSFAELSGESMANYLIEDCNKSFSFFIGLMEHISGIDLSGFNKKTKYREIGIAGDPNENLKCFNQNDSKYLCGFKNHLVFKKIPLEPQMVIGDWIELKNNLLNYNPNDLIARHENYWITTQLDYLNSRRFEAGTSKKKAYRLSIFNMYLFSYLPHYFAINELPYPYPKEIRNFHGFIYISRSITLARHLFGQSFNSLGRFPYPASLIDFITIFRKDENSEVGDTSNNLIRDDLREISRYFDFIIAKYSTVDECRLPSNPISKFDRPEGGSAHGKSKKAKFEYEYWLLFLEYLHAVSESLISNARSFIKSEGKDLCVGRTISVTGKDLKINRVTIPFRNNTMINLKNESIQVLPYQQFCALDFMAAGGLRLSNIMWLDIRTFDKNVTPPENEFDIVDVFVNTDKQKENPFESIVKYRTMKLAQMCASMRKYIKNITQTPIAYQANDKSKNGFIIPVFQYNPSNCFMNIFKKLPKILEGFEQCLTESNINFESRLVLCPTHATIEELQLAKSNFDTIDSPYFTAETESGVKSPFTPIRIKSSVTPHSLRLTFDSFWAVLTSPQLVGDICTGQTKEVVGYYTKNSPEEEMAVKLIAKKMDIPNSPMGKILGVSLLQRSEAHVIATLRKNGLLYDGGFTLGGIHPVDDLEKLFSSTPDDKISIHRTHICIYGDQCPKHVLSVIGSKNCAICFIAISYKRDGPAIAANIKYLLDRIIECNEVLEEETLNKAERAEQTNLRNTLMTEVSGWIARHDHIRKLLKENDLVVMSEGKNEITQRLKYVEPNSVAYHLLNRLEEVQNIPSMQSARLKRTADRISRALLPLLKNGNVSMPELPPVEGALLLIEKIAEIYQLDTAQISNLLENINRESYSDHLIPALNLI